MMGRRFQLFRQARRLGCRGLRWMPSRTFLLRTHILRIQAPPHPQPAPLVMQVLVSQHVNDGVEGLG